MIHNMQDLGMSSPQRLCKCFSFLLIIYNFTVIPTYLTVSVDVFSFRGLVYSYDGEWPGG